jgi:hypothetical protein
LEIKTKPVKSESSYRKSKGEEKMKKTLVLLAVALAVLGSSTVYAAKDKKAKKEAPATVKAAAPAGEGKGKLVAGFENDTDVKDFKISGDNGAITLVDGEGVTEGKKALCLEFDREGKTPSKRPAITFNKAGAFKGAKSITFDYTLTGEVSEKTKMRVKVKDSKGGEANPTEVLISGKNTFTIGLAEIDASSIDSFKIMLDNCDSGKAKLYFDNFRME